MSLKALSDYTIYSRYAHYLPEKRRRETWDEITERVFEMHARRYAKQLAESEEFRADFAFAKEMVKERRVLGSQRALQFGGKWVEAHPSRLFNCSFTHLDRPRVFAEIHYVLLCGAGVGFSVQKQHVAKLPEIKPVGKATLTHQVADSIEGWGDAIDALMTSYFTGGPAVRFDYSLVRPEGALIAGQFKAPGHKGLAQSIERVRTLIERRMASPAFATDQFAGKLRPIDAYDIVMHISDSVLSGGIRRSATISLFSHDDAEMMAAKTGNWFVENAQRGRSNNSVLLVRDQTTWEQFKAIVESTKQFGEPGFYFASDPEHGCNPCFTVDTRILTDGGWRTLGDLTGSQPTILQDARVQGLVNEAGDEHWEVDTEVPNVAVQNVAPKVGITAHAQDVYRLTLACGRTVKATPNHHFATLEGMKRLDELEADDQVLVPLASLAMVDKASPSFKLGYLAGHVMGDGCFMTPDHRSVRLNVWGDENLDEVRFLEATIAEVLAPYETRGELVNYKECSTYQPTFNRDESEVIGNKARYGLQSAFLFQIFARLGFTSKEDLRWLHTQDKSFKAGFVSGFLYTDGHSEWNASARSLSVRLSNTCFACLQEVQLVLQELGVFSRINLAREAGTSLLPDSQRQPRLYQTQNQYRLIIGGQQNCFNLLSFTKLHAKDVARIEGIQSDPKRRITKQTHASRVVSVEWVSQEDVYCLKEDVRRTLIAEGMTARRCVEIGLYPKTADGRSGFAWCNLCEINGKPCDTESRFLEACRAAAIIGTMQAGYTDFRYLTPETKEIADREALLGVSITGVMDNPEVLLSPKAQRAGAKVCKETNARVAKLLGLNVAARITCTKPAGSTSCVLQTASGIHPHHARRYLRRVQANRLEFPLRHYKALNPAAVEASVWSANGTDEVISFACEVPKGAVLKNDLDATALLSKVKSSQVNWVLEGENAELAVSPGLHHNISNTVTVRADEWDKVARYIYDNREFFTGISLLGASGDLDYPQAPFATVLTPEEIVREYGDGSILASGLVVDGLHAFEDNLWVACDQVLGVGVALAETQEPVEPLKPSRRGIKTDKAFAGALADYAIQLNLFYQAMGEYRQLEAKRDWVRRVKQFAERYFGDDVRRATYCLKHVSLWHTWLAIKRTHQPIDWSAVQEDTQDYVAADSLGAAACAGGQCSL